MNKVKDKMSELERGMSSAAKVAKALAQPSEPTVASVMAQSDIINAATRRSASFTAASSSVTSPSNEITSPADLGKMVRATRQQRRLSQQDFADLAGVGRRFISELENGKATLEFGKALKVANAAGISLLGRAR